MMDRLREPVSVRAVVLVYADDGTVVGYELDRPDVMIGTKRHVRWEDGPFGPVEKLEGMHYTITLEAERLTMVRRSPDCEALPAIR